MLSLLLVHVAKWCAVTVLTVTAVSGCGPEQEVPATGTAPTAVIVR